MNRAILEACAPWLAVLGGLCALFVVIVRLSGGHWDVRRIFRLHRSEQGGVQSLAFVLTMPLFVMVLLFIVQVSQLMVGLMVVNYAAFAAARAASVWTPAMVNDLYTALGEDDDGQNELPPGIAPGVEIALTAESVASSGSRKYEKIWTAAILACLPMAPSRSTPDAASGAGAATRSAGVLKQLYPYFDPAGGSNPRIPTRIDNKLGYCVENTALTIQFEDRNSRPRDGTQTFNPIDHPTVTYYPSEVGWQDPITVTVYHDFALLPGAGRLLSRVLNREDGRIDAVAPRIRQTPGVYKTRLRATATMTNEGIRSLRPFVHDAAP